MNCQGIIDSVLAKNEIDLSNYVFEVMSHTTGIGIHYYDENLELHRAVEYVPSRYAQFLDKDSRDYNLEHVYEAYNQYFIDELMNFELTVKLIKNK